VKHIVNNANVGIGIWIRVPNLDKNHCKVNLLFEFCPAFYSKYIFIFENEKMMLFIQE